MTFAHWIAILFGIAATLYLAASVAYQMGGRPGMTVAYIGYAISNCGFIYDAFNTSAK